jgi:hypothetical protein
MNAIATSNDRTTLAKSDRSNIETFYLLTMSADLSRIVFMGDEITEREVQLFFRNVGMPDHEIAGLIENARKMNDADTISR